MRVAFVLRSAEVQPLFRDLCGTRVVFFLLLEEEEHGAWTVNSLSPLSCYTLIFVE